MSMSVNFGSVHKNNFSEMYIMVRKLSFDEMMSVLYQTNKPSWIFAVLAYWNNSLVCSIPLMMCALKWIATNTNIIVFG